MISFVWPGVDRCKLQGFQPAASLAMDKLCNWICCALLGHKEWALHIWTCQT